MLDIGGTVTKGVGYVTTPLAPEVGVPLIEAGEVMSTAADALKVATKFNEGDIQGAVKEIAASGASKLISTVGSNALIKVGKVTGETEKTLIKTSVDLKVDIAKKIGEKITEEKDK